MDVISAIADKIENEKIYPKIIYKKYHNENFGNIEIIYRYECDILYNKIKNNEFIYNDEYYPDEKNVSKYSYVYYYVDNKKYYADKSLISQYTEDLEIPFSIYFKDKTELPIELNDINLKKPKRINSIKINPNNDFVYSIFVEEKYNLIDDTLIQYKNLPMLEYNKIIQPFNQFNYVINRNEWLSTTKTSRHTINLMKSFLINGYIVPIVLLYLDGCYYPISCNTKVITAKLFNMPSIPSIILYSDKSKIII